MGGQNEPSLTEEDIRNMLEDIFEHSIVDKRRVDELYKQVSDRYI